MTMIGPAAANQICPDCEGEGFIEAGEYQGWRSASISMPYIGDYVTIHTYATCDTCAGQGRITKKHLKIINLGDDLI